MLCWVNCARQDRPTYEARIRPPGLGFRVLPVSDTILAYLISLGIIGAGVIWIVAGHSAPSALGVIIGVLTIVVGLLSFFGELST